MRQKLHCDYRNKKKNNLMKMTWNENISLLLLASTLKFIYKWLLSKSWKHIKNCIQELRVSKLTVNSRTRLIERNHFVKLVFTNRSKYSLVFLDIGNFLDICCVFIPEHVFDAFYKIIFILLNPGILLASHDIHVDLKH